MQTITQKTLEDTMRFRAFPILIYKINYPYFTTTCSSATAQEINEYYELSAKAIENYCRSVLYPQAKERAQYLPPTQPFLYYTLDVNYKITYNSRCITSLYMDTYTFLGGAHGETKRTSSTWDFKTGSLLQLNDLFPGTPDSLYNLQKSIEQQISQRILEAPYTYFEDYPILLRESFHPENFYLAPGSFIIFYQQYEIAPYASGIPEFYFPASIRYPVSFTRS